MSHVLKPLRNAMGFTARAAKLSRDARNALAILIAAAAPAIDRMCEKVLGTPGVAAQAKPAIDDLHGRLDALANFEGPKRDT
jgi:hypothetical protein